MRVIFLYTNNSAPAVSTIDNVTSVTDTTVSGVDVYQCVTSGGSTFNLPKASGQIVIQWE